MPGTATTILIDGTPTNGSDAWIDSLVGGGAWTGGNGGPVTIQWTAFQGTMDGQNSYGWTSLALTGLREAMSLWESVANIDFVEVSGATNADVKFWWGTEAQAGGPGVLGWSDLPGFSDSEVLDVLFNAQDSAMYGALDKGSLGLVTMVHEIGHLLGLAHPHDGGAGADATTFPGVDWWWPYSYGDGGLNQGIYTTMSYNFGWSNFYSGPTAESYGLQYGPMALDIAAIQAIYGANPNYASGNNVYKLPTVNGTGTYWSSIWDTGGIDTISNEGSSGYARIDLHAATEGIGGGGRVSYGADYFSKPILGGYTIARGVVIENAIGGDGNDTLIGNTVGNRLEGGTGWDSLDGGAGADTMIGGTGYDTYYVDDSDDVIVELFNTEFEVDSVHSAAANYTLSANIETLTLTGTASINGKGNSTANTITGNSGDNIIESGGGADNLYAGAGNDRLILTDLAFQVADGGAGTDTLGLGGASLALDLANPAIAPKLTGIERIDLSGTGNNTLVVSQASILGGIGTVVSDKYILVVEGNAGDKLQLLEASWTKTGSFNNADGTFDRWIFGNAEIHVEQGVSVQSTPASTVTVLSSLNGSNGFKLRGVTGDRYSGTSVASAGDVNGDGFDDVIVGAHQTNTGLYSAGASYVLFGKASGFAANTDFSALNGSNGFKLSGAAENDRSGYSVASAGDVNGDGFADLIIGAPEADPAGDRSGASYVVFGKASGFGANINLSTLDGSNGFRLSGAAADDFSGWSVASAGDFNNDGFDDVIVGAWGAAPNGSDTGAAYIVYGKTSGFAASTDLSALQASTGFTLVGTGGGISVASVGDVNGDGFCDVIVGAENVHTNGDRAGASYVVFGNASGAISSLDLAALNGSNGFKLSGVSRFDYSGGSVASAGDLNGDGFADLIIGAHGADPAGDRSGASYVVFGKASGFAANVELSTLNGTNGFRLNGASQNDNSGYSVASAGDFNGDGFDDLIVGAWLGDANGAQSGTSYVMFGKASGFDASIDLSTLNGDSGFRIAGANAGDTSGNSVASAGDVNGDGYDDLIIGADHANIVRGESYVVFGGPLGGAFTAVTTTGTAAAEILLGGRGNDLLTGGGSGDVFRAGAGNDRLIVKDLSFRLVDGGTGTDTLVLGGAGLSLDLGNPLVATKLEGIERIDLGGSGNTLIVSQLGVLGGIGAVLGGKHILVVERNSGDQVQFVESGWTKTGSFTAADGTFDRWVRGNSEVHVEQDSAVTIIGTADNDIISTTVTVPGQPRATALGDTIDGRAGADTMAGGAGDDTYIVDNPGDQTIEVVGGGVDLVRSSITWTLGDNVEDLTLTDAASAKGTGNGANNIITGNFGNNVLDGAGGADTMVGGLGDDTYVVDAVGDVVMEGVGEGSDTVEAWLDWTLGANLEQLRLIGAADLKGTGNGQNNVLFGNAGKNVLHGGGGADAMTGGAGDDTYVVDSAGDTVVEAANEGADTVRASVSQALGANVENLVLTGAANIYGTGNGLKNALFGNAGKNVLDGGAGADSMTGGTGDDTYYVDNAGDVVTELADGGVDTLFSSINWTLGANVERLRLMGLADLNGTGNTVNNALFGNAGKNVLNGDAGADTMAGGLGDDTYLVDDAGDVVTENAGEGTDTVEAWLGWTLGANLEQLRLRGTADLNGTGNTLNNTLYGNAGKNVLDGKAGADTMSGGLGDDTYVVENAGDVVTEAAGEGTDTVEARVDWTLGANLERLTLTGTSSLKGIGNALNNVLAGNAGNNVLDGGAGADAMAGGLGNDTYVVDNAGDVVTELDGGGIDTVLSSLNWTLGANIERLTLTGTANRSGTGNVLANTLTGNTGSNVLDGKAGADTMTGGLGDDTYIVDAIGDLTVEYAAEGIDTVQSSLTWRLRTNVEKLVLTGEADIDGSGNELANVLAGNIGANVLDGGAGADTMAGGLGDDTYVVDHADDRANENPGGGIDTVLSSVSHSLRANLENLVLTGAAAINGYGTGEANVLTGNGAANVLDGRAGADTMEGRAGNDTYVVDDAGDVVIEAAGGGTDGVQSSVDYTLAANVETLKLMGAGNLDGTGNGLANVLVGNTGDNRLDGGAGADTMSGGLGDDTYVIDNAQDRATENLEGGTDTVLSSISLSLRAHLENLVLTGTAALNGNGNAQANVLTGNGAANVLDGAAGADTMIGGGGDDTYVVEDAGDMVIEQAGGGTDTVQAWIGHALGAHVEKLRLFGTADIDATGNDLANGLMGNTGRNILDGGLGADTLIGGGGGDTFRFSTALGPDNVDHIVAFSHAADTIHLDDAIFAGLAVGGLDAGAFNLGAAATQADDRILFHAGSKSLYYDADGLGGVAAVKFVTIDSLKGGLDHTDFLIV